MQIRVGYDLTYVFPRPTPVIVTLNVHYSRASDLVRPDLMLTDPPVPIRSYRDGFGNWCTRLVAPQGHLRIFADAVVNDPGTPDPVSPVTRVRGSCRWKRSPLTRKEASSSSADRGLGRSWSTRSITSGSIDGLFRRRQAAQAPP